RGVLRLLAECDSGRAIERRSARTVRAGAVLRITKGVRIDRGRIEIEMFVRRPWLCKNGIPGGCIVAGGMREKRRAGRARDGVVGLRFQSAVRAIRILVAGPRARLVGWIATVVEL